MRIVHDPTVDALTIRLVEERVECEVIQLNDQGAIDIGPGQRLVAIEILDASDLIPHLKDHECFAREPEGSGLIFRKQFPDLHLVTSRVR